MSCDGPGCGGARAGVDRERPGATWTTSSASAWSETGRDPIFLRFRAGAGRTDARQGRRRRDRMKRGIRSLVLGVVLWAAVVPADAAAQAKPDGEMRWALYVTLSPLWFDPAEVTGQLTPFWILYAIHDALVKPMPGNLMSPSLAESWTVSPDGRVYEFKLREGLKFHNGEPFTAEDVKFSFHRAKGSRTLHGKVLDVTVVSPLRVRLTLHEAWPDFMAFYGTMVSGAGWVVPKKYVEQVGNDGFKKHPIGVGPYEVGGPGAGVELVMEANESYWRK